MLGHFFPLCLWPPKMLVSKLNQYFLATQQCFGSSLQHHQITSPEWILPIGRLIRVSQNFQTGIGVATHATLSMEQLISYMRVALVDTISSLQDSEGRDISVSEVCELLTKIHDILDMAVSKWVGNTAHTLSHVFNSAARQHYEVWASHFPFHHSLKGIGSSKWGLSLWSYQLVSGIGSVFHGFVSVLSSFWEVTKPGQRLGSGSVFKIDLCQSLLVPLWQRDLAWRVRLRLIEVAENLLVLFLPALLTLGRRPSQVDGIADMSPATTSTSSSSSFVQVGTLPQFLDQWRSINSNRFVLNIVKGHHLQLRSHHCFFNNF